MPVHVFWDNAEQTIVWQKFEGICTMCDYHHSVDLTLALVKERTHIYCVIMDVRKASLQAKNPLGSLAPVQAKVPDYQGVVVVLGASRFIQTIMKVALHLFPKLAKAIIHVATEEEAYQVVAHYNQHRAGRTPPVQD